MRGLLLDTNVISELRRPKPEPMVVAFIAAQPEHTLFLSEITFAEIRFGIERVVDAERRAALSAWLTHTLRPLFKGRTLGLNEDVILRWRLQIEAGRAHGHTFGQLDLFIAATAAQEQLVVITRDTTHFIAASVPVYNPWASKFTAPAREAVTLDETPEEGWLRAFLRLGAA